MNKLSASLEILHILETNGFEAYIVGGTVRDLALGLHFNDVDIATSASPGEILSLFAEAKIIGDGQLCTVVIPQEKGWAVEVTPFQGAGLLDDLGRRDFTINAMAMNRFGELIDPFGGLLDLTRRVVRFNGRPEDRIKEDPIRCIRLFRFAATLRGFVIDDLAWKATLENLPLFQEVPYERIGKEIYKALGGNFYSFMEALEVAGYLPLILPEIYALKGVPQDPGFHPEGDVYEHTKLCVKNAEALTSVSEIKAAAMFHDIGKPLALKEDDGRIRFMGHEKLGGSLSIEIMKRWAWPSPFVKAVSSLVRWHMIPLISLAPRRIPKLYLEYGKRWLDGLFLLSYIDITSSNGDYSSWTKNREIALSCMFKFSGKEKLISGKDVMDILKIEQGPQVGLILSEIQGLIAEGKIKDRSEAINFLKAKREMMNDERN